MSSQIDNLRSSGSSFCGLTFAGALAKYRELGVSPYLLVGGQHFEGCFANGGMLDSDSIDSFETDPEAGAQTESWSDERPCFDSPLAVSAQQLTQTRQ